jgi:DNA replication protein DnaC
LEFFEKLLAMEVEAREERRIAAWLKVSGLPRGMRLESIDYLFRPSVGKSHVEFLGTSDYIRRAENVLLFGPPGVGKSHLAVGL